MTKSTFVIVGGDVSAGTAASTLRASGFDGRLLIGGRETDYRSLEIELLLE